MIAMSEPGVDRLPGVVAALRQMQHDHQPVQLHPGDLGWRWRFGAEATAALTRTWSRDGRILAVGLLDEPDLLRIAIRREQADEPELADAMATAIADPARGVLPAGSARVEIRFGDLLRGRLTDRGWIADDAWTPLRRDLAAPVEAPGARIEVVGRAQAAERVAVQRAAFDHSTFTESRWHAMTDGIAYPDARCLVARDDQDRAVAGVTVWSAGPGRPGLLEPMGVHRDHRGRGYGTAITVAAAAALRELGSSSATVCTSADNLGAVATYRSAGFARLPDVHDLRRGDGVTAAAG